MLDEIEKAHPEVFNILLQIFDDGHLTDAKGRKVDFRNAVIVMTSNIGAEVIKKDSNIGFSLEADGAKARKKSYEAMKDKVLNEVKQFFRPEFLNRIDAQVVFHALSEEHIREIVDLMILDLEKQLSEKQITIEVTNEARDYIGREGYDETYGARPLRRVIRNLIEDKLSDLILDGTVEEGNDVLVDFVGDEISISVITSKASNVSKENNDAEESNDSEVDGEKSPVA